LIKEWLIDFCWLSFTISHDLHIYRRLDIALFINHRILIKYGEILYLDLSLICENRTLRFYNIEDFQNVITSSYKLQTMCFIYPFWSSRRALHNGGFKSSIWVHILVVSTTSCFLSEIQPNYPRNTWKPCMHGQLMKYTKLTSI
jgi:hypothetical protein